MDVLRNEIAILQGRLDDANFKYSILSAAISDLKENQETMQAEAASVGKTFFRTDEKSTSSGKNAKSTHALALACSSSNNLFNPTNTRLSKANCFTYVFHPDFPDPEDLGGLFHKGQLIFTDVNSFIDWVYDIEDYQKLHILNMLPTLFRGQAAVWWTCEQTAYMRNELRADDHKAIVEALKTRFALSPGTVMHKYSTTKVDIQDIARSPDAVLHHFCKQLRHARALGMLAENYSNWFSVMDGIWKLLPIEISHILKRPTATHHPNISSYFQTINDCKPYLVRRAMFYCRAWQDEHSQGPPYDWQGQ